jgi:hypothetical protein
MSNTSRVTIHDYSTYREVERALALGVEVFDFKQVFSMGALHRGSARVFFELNDIRYYEEKSFLSSEFVVTVDTKAKASVLAKFGRQINALNSLEAADDILENQAQVIKKNKFRKLVFRSPLPVPYEGMNRTAIARTFMAK